MPALQKELEIISIDQYEKLPEEKRIEVFDGFVYNMASPSQAHQTISVEIVTYLNVYMKERKGKCKVFAAPFDVKLSDYPLTVVQPDIMVVCDLNKLDKKRCNGAPDLIIEIVSPSSVSDDYIRKLYYYKKYGVREYWIVDPQRRIVTVNYFEENVLSVQYNFCSTIKVNIYEDLFIRFSDITENIDL